MKMNQSKRTYAEILKTQPNVDPKLTAEPLIIKTPRARLTKEAKANLRAIIKGKDTMMIASEGYTPVIISTGSESAQESKRSAQPLVLATASDWVVRGSVMSNAMRLGNHTSSVSSVQLLKPEEITNTMLEGKAENPIEVYDDDADKLELNCGENLDKNDNYSVVSVSELADTSKFDPDVAFKDGFEVFDSSKKTHEKNSPELETMLRLDATDELRRAKRRMETSFMTDYSVKMKQFKRLDRPEYEGEYTFVVRVIVDDSNTVEVKDTITYCKLRKVSDESEKSEDEFNPDENDYVSDTHEKKRPVNRSGQSTFFDPVRQITKYNKTPLPQEIPIIPITEKPTETAEYHWLKTYEPVPSNSQFNRFLNCFRLHAPNAIYEFEGVRYRFLRVGTTSKLNSVRLYRQFVIGNNFTIFRLGCNGAPNVNLNVTPEAREKRFPPPINKKFTIASLFWANELLKTQKSW